MEFLEISKIPEKPLGCHSSLTRNGMTGWHDQRVDGERKSPPSRFEDDWFELIPIASELIGLFCQLTIRVVK
jgi:hypothetical protein